MKRFYFVRSVTFPDALIFFGVFLSQFYFFKSGYPQPANIIFLFFAFFVLFLSKEKGVVAKFRGFNFLVFFFFWVVFVNLFWSINLSSYRLNFFSVYLSYNLVIFFSFKAYLERLPLGAPMLSASIGFSLMAALLVWFSGGGEYFFFPRYNGTFNDPNQMAFWVLCLTAIFFLLNNSSTLVKILVGAVAVCLVFLTMSRSALLGLAVMFVGVLMDTVSFSGKKPQKSYASFLALLVFVAFLAVPLSKMEVVETAFSRFETMSVDNQLEARGYVRLIDYPEYLFLGAGQGEEERFDSDYEIHSTWVGFFFYYGFVGLIAFCFFIARSISALPWHKQLITLGPLVYGFSTFGGRSTVFWLFCAALVHVSTLRYSSKKDDR